MMAEEGAPQPATPVTANARVSPVHTVTNDAPNSDTIPQDVPKSPAKRPLETEAGQATGDTKRQKLEEEAAEDPFAANWDLGLELENALGTLDVPSTDMAVDGLPLPSAHDLSQEDPIHAIQADVSQSPVRERPQPKLDWPGNRKGYLRKLDLRWLREYALAVLFAISGTPHDAIRDVSSDAHNDLVDLVAVLEHAKTRFPQDNMMLAAGNPDDTTIEDREIIRIANLATLCSRLFHVRDGGLDTPLQMGNGQLLNLLLPENGELTEDAFGLCLSFKSKMLIEEAVVKGRETVGSLLDKYFPATMADTLKEQFPLFEITNGNVDIELLVRERREKLVDYTSAENFENLRTNEHKYSPTPILDELGTYLRAHLPLLVDHAERWDVPVPHEQPAEVNVATEDEQEPGNDVGTVVEDLNALLGNAAVSPEAEASGASPPEPEPKQEPGSNEIDQPLADSWDLGQLIQDSLQRHDTGHETAKPDESDDLVSYISQHLNGPEGPPPTTSSAMQYQPTLPNPSAPIDAHHNPSLAQVPHQYSQPYYTPYQQQHADTTGAPGEYLPPEQSCPTSVLYERARHAAAAKSSAHSRREGLHSTRRPWSPEEEKALMMGLDQVKGPHWSQILQLYGPNGSISTILKERSQVQLKDKARNLKLFFLKTSCEIPYYLRCVTGELKTRAPSQAARREAEEKARMTSEEDQNRFAGLMALSSMRDQHSQSPAAPTPAATSAPVLPPSVPTSSTLSPGPSIPGGVATTTTPADAAIPNMDEASIKTEPREGSQSTNTPIQLPQLEPANGNNGSQLPLDLGSSAHDAEADLLRELQAVL